MRPGQPKSLTARDDVSAGVMTPPHKKDAIRTALMAISLRETAISAGVMAPPREKNAIRTALMASPLKETAIRTALMT